MVLTDFDIRERLTLPLGSKERLVIEPFVGPTRPEGRPSHGLSYCGYDVRLCGKKVLRYYYDEHSALRPGDAPCKADTRYDENSPIILPGHGFALASTMEYFEIPYDCVGQVFTKSTWARLGLCLNCTPLEPGWCGYITLELANLGPRPIEILPGDGIGQVIFHQTKGFPMRAYSGVYQGQEGATGARVVQPGSQVVPA